MPFHLVTRRAAAWFEPAWRDLWIDHVSGLARATNRRQAVLLRFRYRLTVAWLVLDCWRLTGFDRSRPAPPTALKPRERFQMFASDVRHAIRRLIREPGFALATGLTLALGVGANVASWRVCPARGDPATITVMGTVAATRIGGSLDLAADTTLRYRDRGCERRSLGLSFRLTL